MLEYRYPFPGDVLFFEPGTTFKRGKAHGTVIARAQKMMGLAYYQYMHAALVVDGDMVMEAKFLLGVRKIKLSTLQDLEERSDYLNATVMRKPGAQSLSLEERTRLAYAAYYFFKEFFNVPGILASWLVEARVSDRDKKGRSICSQFVEKALRRADAVSAAAFEGYSDPIYPAELFSALANAGYEPLTGGYDSGLWRSRPLLPDFIDVIECSQVVVIHLDGVSDKLDRVSLAQLVELEKMLCQDSPALWKFAVVFGASKRTFLEFMQELFTKYSLYYAEIDRKIKTSPKNWRDRKSIRSLVDRAIEHVKLTFSFDNAFGDVLIKPLTILTDGERVQGDKLFDLALAVFLVTGARTLDELDAKIEGARVKLQYYKTAVGGCLAAAKCGLPSLSDDYEKFIDNLKTYATLLRTQEGLMGTAVAPIFGAAGRVAQQVGAAAAAGPDA